MLACVCDVAPAAVAAPDTPHHTFTGSSDSDTPSANCTYSGQPNTTYRDPNNVILCLDDEGAPHCRQRCDVDPECAGFGVYYPLGSGRCCTKRLQKVPTQWLHGESFTKVRDPRGQPGSACGPQLPPVPVNMTTIFTGNTTFPYSKGAMLEVLPDGTMVAALQAGPAEAAVSQRVLVARSTDGGSTFGDYTVAVPSTGGAQWEPTLFHDKTTGLLWLFYTEGPTLMYVTQSADGGQPGTWAPRRLIWNGTAHGHSQVWAINRVVVLADGSWVLPCDFGCARPTAAVALISADHGVTWATAEPIPGTNISGCPEPGMASTGGVDLIAVIRSTGVGLLQSFSSDGGHTWTAAVAAGVDGASSKPSIVAVPPFATRGDGDGGSGGGAGRATLIMAYNVETRLRMELATSADNGATWLPWATIDDGSNIVATFYPTVLADTVTNTVLTVYSATRAENSTANKCPRLADDPRGSTTGCFTDMRLVKTTMPTWSGVRAAQKATSKSV